MVLVLLVLFAVDLAVPDLLGVHLGHLPVPTSAPVALAIVVLVAIGRPPPELVGWRLAAPAWRPLAWPACTLVATLAVAAVLRTGHPDEVASVALHATDEEVLFRLAVPTVVAIGLGWVGASRAVAGGLGIAGAAWVFAVMPGHLQQMSGHVDVLPFLAFGLATGFAAWRTRSVVPGVLVHLVANLTGPAGVPVGAGTVVEGAALVVLVLVAEHRPTVVVAEIDPAGPHGPASGTAPRLVERPDGISPSPALPAGRRRSRSGAPPRAAR